MNVKVSLNYYLHMYTSLEKYLKQQSFVSSVVLRCVCACACARVYTYILYVYIYIHKHTHIYMHTHAHICIYTHNLIDTLLC